MVKSMIVKFIGAMVWEAPQLSANNIGANRPTHPRILISTLQFAIHLVSLSKISGKDQVNIK